MQYIDLHTHSTCSDGTFTPEELAELAIDKGLVALALTDHDTVSGVSRLIDAAKDRPLRIIRGVEISCEQVLKSKKKKEIHILGYNIDIKDDNLLDTLTYAVDGRDSRNKKMCENLNKAGYPITYEELINRFGNVTIARPHFARILMEKGVVKSISSAFDHILAENGPYYVHRQYVAPKTAIERITDAGGVAVLAHPMMYKLSVSEIRAMLDELKGYGLRGIEALYSRNKGNDEAFVRKLAGEYDLFITGGSDFHGANKPDIEIGYGEGNLRVPAMLLDALR